MEYWIILIAITLVILLFPRWGLLAAYKNYLLAKEREQIEHALKYLLDRQYQLQESTQDLLSRTLRLSRAESTKLIERMVGQGLIEAQGANLSMTPGGERWALQIIRAHRLWERYLAYEAHMPLERIHKEAHRLEHKTSEHQLEELDAALGFPTQDPHGDPIPSAEGKINISETTSILDWPADKSASIVHLEDEPPLAYQQILASGIRLGMTVRVLERSPERVVLSDGENEFHLAPAVAANIHVVSVRGPKMREPGLKSLMELQDNQRAEIVSLDETVQGFTRRRFLDLGLTPGATVYPELPNFFGEPRAYRIRGTLIALRKDQASQIWVKPIATT